MPNERTLVIIDDQLFSALEKVQETKDVFDLRMSDIADIISNYKFLDTIQKQPSLLNLMNHASVGHFHRLTRLLVFDLARPTVDHDLFSKHFLSVPDCAILLDIYSEKEEFPEGKNLSDYLDQSPYADRIAWLSVTGRLSQEYKPYPLIRKREIAMNFEKRDDGERDTLFLWWGGLFKDFELDFDPDEALNGTELGRALRQQWLVTTYNIESTATDLYRTSTKRARKGGLAGNIIKPILWQIHEGEEKGKIVNAFLKIKANDDGGDLQTEVDFQKNNGLGIPFPKIYYHQPEFYCMEKISWTNFSDFIFEQIGPAQVSGLLSEILGRISAWHQSAPQQPVNDSLVLKQVATIRKRLNIWVEQNPLFEPLLYPKTLIINNLQYFNALYLLNRIEEKYTVENGIEPTHLVRIHGDLVAQNIFVDNVNNDIRVIDPRGSFGDYLADYVKLFSSFSGQGHLEYVAKNPNSGCAHFETNKGIDSEGCYYVCAPSLSKMDDNQQRIIDHIRQLDTVMEKQAGNWENRFLLGLAAQYLGAPPFRDSIQFQYEMKFLYYRGVEILNEFCERMGYIEHRTRIFKPE